MTHTHTETNTATIMISAIQPTSVFETYKCLQENKNDILRYKMASKKSILPPQKTKITRLKIVSEISQCNVGF